MAELNVQPKKKGSWWPWLLLLLLGIAIAYFLLRDNNKEPEVADTEATTAGAATTADANDGWGGIDFNAPAATYDEITDADINVRGNDEYAIYSVDETILFDVDKNNIRSQAEDKLKQIAQSVGQRFNGGQIRIYGHTDAQGSAGYNQQLAEQRAEAVQKWLVQNGGITADQVTLHPVGESQPVASNATAEGRQQNRRVEIVARRGNQ